MENAMADWVDARVRDPDGAATARARRRMIAAVGDHFRPTLKTPRVL